MLYNPFSRISHQDISVVARGQGRGNENMDGRWHEIQIIASLQFLAAIIATILAFTLIEDWECLTAAGVAGGFYVLTCYGLHKMSVINRALGIEEIQLARKMRANGKSRDEIREHFKAP